MQNNLIILKFQNNLHTTELIIIYYNFHIRYKHTNHQLFSNKRGNFLFCFHNSDIMRTRRIYVM